MTFEEFKRERVGGRFSVDEAWQDWRWFQCHEQHNNAVRRRRERMWQRENDRIRRREASARGELRDRTPEADARRAARSKRKWAFKTGEIARRGEWVCTFATPAGWARWERTLADGRTLGIEVDGGEFRVQIRARPETYTPRWTPYLPGWFGAAHEVQAIAGVGSGR